MKSEKGLTLTALVIYILIATAVISSIALLSSYFFSNMNVVKEQSQYAPEFNKFSMFFLEDVRNNSGAEVTTTKVTFADGTVYEYKSNEKAVYRNTTKITERLDSFSFATSETVVKNTKKQIITVKMAIGDIQNAPNGIEYVLKYW